MSRCIVFLSVCLSFGILLDLRAEPSSYSRNYGEKTNFEVGLRTGLGERVPGRFDGDLQQFSSSFSPLVFSDISLTGGRQTSLFEAFFRVSLDQHSKVGFIVGRNDWATFRLTEVTSDLYYTRLNFVIYSYHMLAMYYFTYPILRNWEWESGLGLGFSSADWQTNGYSVGGFDPDLRYFRQVGILRGSGLAFRGETAMNHRLYENTFFQIGVGYHHIAIDKFSGNYNGDASSFYVSSSGQVGVFDDTRIADIALSSAQSFRRLDMSSGSWILYFSVFQRFLD